MKASLFRSFGGPEVLEYGELPDPVPGPGEVLVDIHAASVNAADWKMRGGEYAALKDFPHVLGRDFSGVVSAVYFASSYRYCTNDSTAPSKPCRLGFVDSMT